MKTIILFSFVLTLNLPARATVHRVKVSNFQFSPKRVNALVGDTILWVYKIGFHTTTSTGIPVGATPWDSPMDANTTRFSYVVSVPGTYNYTCLPHASEMKGIIKVFANKPAVINSFTVTINENGKPGLYWNIVNAESLKAVSVQRSFDGETFEEVSKILLNNNVQNSYVKNYADDAAPANKYIYYLLETTDQNNEIVQTDIKLFNFKVPSKLVISLSPNPLTSQHLLIKFNSVTEANMKAILQDEKGNVVIKENMWAEQGINNAHIHLGNLLKPGTYYLVCIMGTKKETYKLVKL